MDYKKVSIALGFVVAFLVGCVAREVGGVRLAPPARAGISPQRWEYIFMPGQTASGAQRDANAAGERGWEFVGTSADESLIFKRPLP